MAIDYAAIGHLIQTQRKNLHMTQEDLAEKTDITVVYLSKVENGRVHPTLELLDRLSVALHIELSTLLTGVQTEAPHYGDEQVHQLFTELSPRVKPIALRLLKDLTELERGK